MLTTHIRATPFVDDFKIDKGVITDVGVFFPPGCHGVVHTKVFLQAHQILPRNQESWCRGNNGWWREDACITVVDSPLQVKVVAWSLNADYDHVITVSIELIPFSQFAQWDKVVYLLQGFAEAFGIETPWQPQEKEEAVK